MSKKKSRGRPSKNSLAARKGWATRRANAARAKRAAAARKGHETRRRNLAAAKAAALKSKRSAAAKRGHATRKKNARQLAKPVGAPQGTGDYAESPPPPRETGGYQSGGIYGGDARQQEPEYRDFDDWDYDDLDEGLDSEADDDGDTGGESAKT